MLDQAQEANIHTRLNSEDSLTLCALTGSQAYVIGKVNCLLRQKSCKMTKSEQRHNSRGNRGE